MFDENLSDMGKTSSEGPPTDMGLVEEFDDLISSEDLPLDEGFGTEDLLDPRHTPSEERRALIESAVTGAVKRSIASSGDSVRPSESSGSEFDPSDPRVRQAFERAVRKAMDLAFDSFLEELRRGRD